MCEAFCECLAHFALPSLSLTYNPPWIILELPNGTRFSDVFAVVPELPEKAVIGELSLRKWRIHLNPEQNEVIFDPEVAKMSENSPQRHKGTKK